MSQHKHPLALHWFCTVHFCERFSYYGIQSLLLLYLIDHLNFSDAKSYAIFGVYGALTYLTPLLGGYIADKLAGFYATIWLGLMFIIVGHGTIFFASDNTGFFLGLGLISTGSGFYKSNMNALIGNLYDKMSPLKDSAYTIFYTYQNGGAFTAPLVCGYLGLSVGWLYGFTMAALGAIIALILFTWCHKFKRIVHSSQSIAKNFKLSKTLALIVGGIILSSGLGALICYGDNSLDILTILSCTYFIVFFRYYYISGQQDRQNLKIVFLGILAVALSGALIGHGYTVFTLLMSRNVDTTFLSWDIPTTFIQSIDPLTVVILGPILALVWKAYTNRVVSAQTKLLYGFVIIVIAYASLVGLCAFPQNGHLIPVIPFIIGLVVLASSDILIYPNVLSLCSRVMPPHLTGVMMGFIVFGMSLSQLFGTYFAKMAALPTNISTINSETSLQIYQSFFINMVGISFITLVVLFIGIKWINKNSQNGSE